MLNVLLDHPDQAVRQQLTEQLIAQGCQVTQGDSSGRLTVLPRFENDLAIVPRPASSNPESLRPYLDGQRGTPLLILVEGPHDANAESEASSAAVHLRWGAFDTWRLPATDGEIQSALWKAQQYLQARRLSCLGHGALSGPDELLGSSAPMQMLRQLVRKVARTDATVLVHGEPGTGKSLVARLLHLQSGRAQQPFIAFDCWSVPSARASAELFGPEGTITPLGGGTPSGLLRLADHATVLLDEVADLATPAQQRLLAFLQQPSLRSTTVRLIATTNRSLEEQISQGAFNEELYFRLNILPIEVPPLRARPEDIPMLADHFRHLATRKYGTEILAISADALKLLQDYSWPGNVRELETAIAGAVLAVKDGALLEPQHFPTLGGASPTPMASETTFAPLPTLGELEKQHIFLALERCRNNRTHAAKLLGISIRTLRNKLREYRQQTEQLEPVSAVAG